MLEHGGRLRAAAIRHGIPEADWLDLSTGINPQGWPVPALPASVWQRLPEEDDGLEAAAASYYGNAALLSLPGSQAAIQSLPLFLPRASIACLGPVYNEHPQAWQRAGHRLRLLRDAPLARALAAATPYVLLCNPNNPTARAQPRAALLAAAQELAARGGWLIVDEAFIDPTPEESLAPLAGTAAAPNLIVLRSLGKFFGLAGIRVGFIFAAEKIRAQLAEHLGPWAVAGPSREAARLALNDRSWQENTRAALLEQGRRLQVLLAPLGEVRATALFATLKEEKAAALHEFFARRAILTRHYAPEPLLRFGLPPDELGWQRLATAIAEWKKDEKIVR